MFSVCRRVGTFACSTAMPSAAAMTTVIRTHRHQKQQYRFYVRRSPALLAAATNGGGGVGVNIGGKVHATSKHFDPTDLDVSSLQHPYWDTDLDFFVPYADDEVGDEGGGGFRNPLDGDEISGEFLDFESQELLNVPKDGKELLGKEWK